MKDEPTRDQWFSKEYLGGEKPVGQMLNGYQPMPGQEVVEKFLYFYGAYAPKANLNKFMLYSSTSHELDPQDPLEVTKQKYLEIG
jgi:predicted transposase YdaD